jgi:hypothetical protein
MRKMREKIKSRDLSQIMPIPGPQVQTRMRRRTQTKSPEDGVHGLLLRYAFWIPVLACGERLILQLQPSGTHKATGTQVKEHQRLTWMIYYYRNDLSSIFSFI